MTVQPQRYLTQLTVTSYRADYKGLPGTRLPPIWVREFRCAHSNSCSQGNCSRDPILIVLVTKVQSCSKSIHLRCYPAPIGYIQSKFQMWLRGFLSVDFLRLAFYVTSLLMDCIVAKLQEVIKLDLHPLNLLHNVHKIIYTLCQLLMSSTLNVIRVGTCLSVKSG